jgi:hypothetical protein
VKFREGLTRISLGYSKGMRALSVWDGSSHAMTALEQVLPLFRPSAFSHIEIMMLVWPQSDTAMWSDILERQLVSGDLHRAAAEISTSYAERLRTTLSSIAENVHVSIVNAEAVGAVKTAILDFRADIVFFIMGSVGADSQIATNLQEVLRGSPVPVSVLHAPARADASAPS